MTYWERIKFACGHSRMIALSYGTFILAALDEAKVLDWSNLIGTEKGGRIAAVLGLAIFGLRMVTTGPVSWRKDPQ